MKKTQLAAGTYVLVKLEDLEFFNKLSEARNHFYIDVLGRDAKEVVGKTTRSDAHLEVLRGRVRLTFSGTNSHRLMKEQATKIERFLASMPELDATTRIGSHQWVGHKFEGYEHEGMKTEMGPSGRCELTMLHLATDLPIEAVVGTDGVSSVTIGKSETKKPARKRNSKGRFENSETAASAK